MKDTKIEQPDNERDVLVWVLMTGWMMSRYINGKWHLFFSDTGLNESKNQDFVVRWMELPERPENIVNPDWYHGKY